MVYCPTIVVKYASENLRCLLVCMTVNLSLAKLVLEIKEISPGPCTILE